MVIALVAITGAPLVPASTAHGPGPSWLGSGPLEGELSFSALSAPRAFHFLFPSLSAFTGPQATRELGFLWTWSGCWGAYMVGKGATRPPLQVSSLKTAPPFSETTAQRFLNTQFNLKQAQVQTIHKSF